MRIKRVFNNNAVIAYKDDSEVVIFGKGVGYQKKHGDELDRSKIEKVFVANEKHVTAFEDLFDEIHPEYINLTYSIVNQAESDLNIEFNSSTYIAILDHINYALERYKDNLCISNPLKWEIKRTYKQEYAAALKTLDIIEEETGIRLSEDEAATIAIHYYNASNQKFYLQNSLKSVEIIQDIIKITQIHFKMEFDENDINYSRFMTHLNYFINELMNDARKSTDIDNEFLYEQLKNKYPDIHACVLKIKQFIYLKTNKEVKDEELVYLMIHIHRIIEKEKQKKGEN